MFTGYVENDERRDIIGQPTRLGIQKGHTLLRTLKRMSDKNSLVSDKRPREEFDILKKERRFEIIQVIKASILHEVTITDIKVKSRGVLAQCGEKTLQRELISMVRDGVLKKTGEKRWSKYSIVN